LGRKLELLHAEICASPDLRAAATFDDTVNLPKIADGP
jgi:hypothetical protein